MIFEVSKSAVFPRMKNLHTKKTSNRSNFGWLIQQTSINQKSGRQTFRRRFVSGSLFVSPCLPECYLQSKMKIEPDLRLGINFHHVLMEFQFLITKTQDRTFLQTFKVRIQVLWCKKNTALHKKVHIPDWKLTAHTWLSSLDPCPHDAVAEVSALKPSLLFLILYPA